MHEPQDFSRFVLASGSAAPYPIHYNLNSVNHLTIWTIAEETKLVARFNNFTTFDLQLSRSRGKSFHMSHWLFVAAAAGALMFASPAVRAQATGAAFPTTTGQPADLQLPTDNEDAMPDAQDEDNVEVRDRTPEDDAKIAKDKAAKAARDAKKAGQTPTNLDTTEQPAANLTDAPIVKDVVISGADSDDTKKALRVLTTRAGEPLNPDKQRTDIDRLYDLGIFQPNILVQAEDADGGVIVKYVVQPNPKVASINVTGNIKVPTNKIISELPVKAGETYTVQAQNKIRDSITRLYEDKGFSDAAVTVDERPNSNGHVDLNIAVDEGTKTKIRNLVIQGDAHVNEALLKLKANNKGSWGPFKHYYNDAKFEQDLNTVRQVYANKGFLDADVHRGEFNYAADRSWVDPVIVVNEGPQYHVGRLEANGYTVFGRDEILEPFRSCQGKVYNQSDFQKRAERVKNMYGDEGFMTCSVSPDFHKDPSTGLVDVDVDVNEGPRIYVGDVRVVSETYPDDTKMSAFRKFYSRFSPPVKDEVVQREVRLRPGQVYRRFDEVRTKERLTSLNVFDKVNVSEQLTADTNVRDLVVQVEQGNTGNLIFGAGFGDVEGGFVYANYIEHNLFGLARDLRVSLLLGTQAMSGEISYLDRYFLGTDIAAQFTAFHRRLDLTGSFIQTNTGATAEFTRPLSECLKDSLRVRLEAVGYDLKNHHRPDTDISDYLAATLRYRITNDTRDDTFFPTSGHLAIGSVESGVAKSFLLKFEGQYASYMPINDDWVFANNTLAGLMPTDPEKIGYADRLFMGGGNDLRGFRISGAGPHDSRNHSIPLGGATKLISQFELRHRFTDNLAGVLFADVGMLGHDPLEIDSPRASVGAGIRLRLPVASVALDLGVPVVSKKDDQTQIIHFNMTSSF